MNKRGRLGLGISVRSLNQSRAEKKICWLYVCCILKLLLSWQNLPVYIPLSFAPFANFIKPLLTIVIVIREL